MTEDITYEPVGINPNLDMKICCGPVARAKPLLCERTRAR